MDLLKVVGLDALVKPADGLMVRDWSEDVVQLVQFPRTHTIVSLSPYSLKLETWLRMAGIKYRNVSNQLTTASSKGQVPFVELNGRQLADSNMIIDHLRDHFHVPIDDQLSAQEKAQARAFHFLIEESLCRCIYYDRAKDFGWLATDQGLLPHVPTYQKFLFQKFIIKQLQRRIKNASHAQGYGRHSVEEIEALAKQDLLALSTQLGNKPFMFGQKPTTVDATLFGHLTQLTDTPLHCLDQLKSFVEQSTPNLVEFVHRVKQTYWPDWAQICETLALNPPAEERENEKQKP